MVIKKTIEIIQLIFLFFFTGPLGFLFKVQIDNFRFNKTTAERFKRREVHALNSSSLA